MRKLIFKCKLGNRDNFEDRLAHANLDFGAIYWQHDRVYVPRGYRRGQNYPRLVLRTDLRAVDQPPVYYLVLRRHIEDSGIDVVEETPVIDYAAALNIVLQLGFRPAGEVSRRRQELYIAPGTVVYLDEIDGRGETFIKLETDLADGASVAEARARLEQFLALFTDLTPANYAYFEL